MIKSNHFEHWKHIFSYVFQILLILFLLALLIREFNPELINTSINLDWFMVIVIIFGALAIIFPPEKEAKKDIVRNRDHVLIILLGIAGGILLFVKLHNLGWISYIISILGGSIIIFLSWFLINEKDEETI